MRISSRTCCYTGGLRAVYHGGACAELKELTRAYRNLTEDETRVKLRLKSLFRARAVRARGDHVYAAASRSDWLAKLEEPGVRFRAETLYAELDVLRGLRSKARRAMGAKARRDPAWKVLRSIPGIGPIRASLLMATIQTPWRFRTKRNLWAYSGLAVVTHTSAEHDFVDGRPVRRKRAPRTRGLNRNYNRVLKDVFKGAALVALGRPGALQDLYEGMLSRGMRAERARVTLARKIAALTLRLWKEGEVYDEAKLKQQET